MKALSFLNPILGLIKNFGFIYRLIGIGICFTFFTSNFQDLMFLSSSKDAEPMTIEELKAIPKSEIPRYLKLKDLMLMSDSYVATQDEDSGRILDASYPVYSTQQLAEYDSLNPSALMTHVIIKDKDFHEDSLSFFMNVDGMYDNSSLGEVRTILSQNGVNVSPDAILIVKEKAPAFSSSLMWTLLTGIGGLLIALSFIPNSMLGMKEENEVVANTNPNNPNSVSNLDDIMNRDRQ